MNVPRLNLIVLRSKDINYLREFYESLGLQFTLEQHDEGSQHYSCTREGIIFELYPMTKETQDNCML